MGRSILGYAVTSPNRSPIYRRTQSGMEMVERARSGMVTCGSTVFTRAGTSIMFFVPLGSKIAKATS